MTVLCALIGFGFSSLNQVKNKRAQFIPHAHTLCAWVIRQQFILFKWREPYGLKGLYNFEGLQVICVCWCAQLLLTIRVSFLLWMSVNIDMSLSYFKNLKSVSLFSFQCKTSSYMCWQPVSKFLPAICFAVINNCQTRNEWACTDQYI